MQCVEEELGKGVVKTVDPKFVPVVSSDDASNSEPLGALPESHEVRSAVSVASDAMTVAAQSIVSPFGAALAGELITGVAAADRCDALVIDGSDDDGDEYFEENDDDDELDDDFDDLDDLDDDYEDEEEEDEEFDPDLEDLG